MSPLQDSTRPLVEPPAAYDRPPFALETGRTTPLSVALVVVGELRADTAELLCMVIDRHVALGRVHVRVDASRATTVDAAALDLLAAPRASYEVAAPS